MDRYIEHLKSAHANAQGVIQFLDQKASIVFGIVVFVIGSCFVLFSENYIHEMDGMAQCRSFECTEWSCFAGLLLFGAFMSSVLCASSLISCLKARGPTLKGDLVLFPCYKKSYDEVVVFFDRFKNSNDITDSVLREYENQVYTLGCILDKKMKYIRRLMVCFALLVLFAGMLFVLVCAQLVFCG